MARGKSKPEWVCLLSERKAGTNEGFLPVAVFASRQLAEESVKAMGWEAMGIQPLYEDFALQRQSTNRVWAVGR